MANPLVPFQNRPPESIVTEDFVDMFGAGGWTDLAPGGDWWGANGAWAVFGFGTNVPEGRAEKTLTGFAPNTMNIVRLNMTWTTGTGTGFSFGVWVNDVFYTLAGPPSTGDVVVAFLADGAGEVNLKVGGINLFGSVNVIGGFNSTEGTTLSSEFRDIIIDSATLIVDGMQLTASRGSWAFDPGEEWEDLPFPGRVMNTKGCRRLKTLKPIIRGNAMMTGETQITVYRPSGTWGAHASIAGGRTFTPNALRSYLSASDYHRVFIVWKRQRGDYFAVEFPTAICGGYSIGSQDGDEGQLPLVFEAVQDPASGTTKTRIPYRLHTLPADTEPDDL